MFSKSRKYAIGNATRISIGLLFIVASALGVSYSLGLLPSPEKQRAERRLEVAQSLAIQFSAAIENRDIKHVQELAGSVIGSLPDVASIGLRRADDRLVFASSGHEIQWKDAVAGRNSKNISAVKVALLDHDKPWGQIELIFRVDPVSFRTGTLALVVFVSLSSLLGFLMFMKRTLRVLDPSQVIPERVRLMLDTLAEGAAIVDSDGRIVLANQSLSGLLGTTAEKLLGTRLEEFDWKLPPGQAGDSDAPADEEMPWVNIKGELNCRGRMVQLQTGSGPRSLVVNASSIAGGGSGVRGYLFTFDDVTAVEQKNQQLVKMVDQLGQAQEKVQRQNEELRRLATRDPLTDCLN